MNKTEESLFACHLKMTKIRKLVVLQAVARAFHFDHGVASLGRPELDKVGKASVVGLDVDQDPLAPLAQVAGRDAGQRQLEQLVAQCAPVDEGRGDAGLVAVIGADGVAVTAVVQLGKAISPPSQARTRGRSISTLPPWKPTLPRVFPHRWPSLPTARP